MTKWTWCIVLAATIIVGAAAPSVAAPNEAETATVNISTDYSAGFGASDRGISVTFNLSAALAKWKTTSPNGDVTTNISGACWQAIDDTGLMKATVNVTADITDQLVVYIDHTKDAGWSDFATATDGWNKRVNEGKVSTSDIDGLISTPTITLLLQKNIATPNIKIARIPLRFFSDGDPNTTTPSVRSDATNDKWTYIGNSWQTTSAKLDVGILSILQPLTFNAWILPGLTKPKVNGEYIGIITFSLVTQ